MKIIKTGDKCTACWRCGCIMEYGEDDILTGTYLFPASTLVHRYESVKYEYVECPECGSKVQVGCELIFKYQGD